MSAKESKSPETETKSFAQKIEAANLKALERMTSARPVLKTVATARDVVPDMGERLLLHAGPPIEWGRMSGPLRGAIIGAAIFEGWADTAEAAAKLAASGDIAFAPCHHHQTVGPMAGVTSPSMEVYVVENETHGNRAYSNLNEGYGKVLRYGAYSSEVLDRLRWMNEVMRLWSETPWSTSAAWIYALFWPKPCTWAMKVTIATRPAPC